MPNRVCRRCGKEYEGPYGSSLCPVCVKGQRAAGNIKPKICRTCGVEFPGGPRAYYCPDCRAERKKEADLRCKSRRAAGKTRAIGSEDLCIACGKPYTVASGRQQYCERCAIERRNENALARYHADPDAVGDRRERRAAGNPTVACVICGKLFVKSGCWITCSQECSNTHSEQLRASWAAEHPERVAELNKDWYRRLFESMAPEELES